MYLKWRMYKKTGEGLASSQNKSAIPFSNTLNVSM